MRKYFQKLISWFSVDKILPIIGFLLLLTLYYLSERGTRSVYKSREIIHLFGNFVFPKNSLAGVYSSISCIILICFVLFYRKIGFYTSLIVIANRFLHLFRGFFWLGEFPNLPALFLTIVALTAILVIYSRNEQLRKANEKYLNKHKVFTNSIINAFATCIDGKDSYTNGHSLRVAKYTRMLAQKLGEKGENLEFFYNIALLHDIGKIGIPDSILNNPGKLTSEEYDIMKSHPRWGYDILREVKLQDDITAGAHYHHERFDGKGYPDGLSGYSIPWIARIIAVADTLDAMSSTRPYRKKLPMDFIVKEIQDCSGTQFDPAVVNAFMELYNEGAFKDIITE